tara:strand:+ start:9784 stop:10653 length:870 start_codon:yes stop_codon:yes gene_type:complete
MFKHNFKLFVLALISSFIFSGCGAAWFVHPEENPIIEDKVGSSKPSGHELGTLATTSERRIVLVKMQGEQKGKFCAEPSPDTADNLASSLSLLVEAQIKKPEAQGSGKSEISKTLATTVEKLGVRSQGVQFFRDGMYNLCQAYLNQAVTEPQFLDLTRELRDKAADLITVELKYKDSIVAEPPQQLKTPEQLLESQREQKLKELQAKTVLQAEKDKKAAEAFLAESKLKEDMDKAELKALKAENELQAERDRAEIEKLQAELNKLKKIKEIESEKEAEVETETSDSSIQ